MQITKHLSRQLLAIGLKEPNERIFAKPNPASRSLDALFSVTLDMASLSNFNWNDFVRWSSQQSPATRLQVATRWDEVGCP